MCLESIANILDAMNRVSLTEMRLLQEVCCATYADCWRNDPSLAQHFASDLSDCLKARFKRTTRIEFLFYNFVLSVRFDNLERATDVFNQIIEATHGFYFEDPTLDDYVKMSVESIVLKSPFVSCEMLSRSIEAQRFRKDVLGLLDFRFPEDPRVNYICAIVSYYIDEDLVSAYHVAKNALSFGQTDDLIYGPSSKIMSKICCALQYDDMAVQYLEESERCKGCSPLDSNQLYSDDLFYINKIYKSQYNTSELVEITRSMISEDAGEEMYYAQRCAAHALNLLSDKRFDEALQWISRANAVFDDPRITKYMADIAFEIGDYNNAIKHYRRANVWLLAGQQIYEKLQTTETGDKLREALHCMIGDRDWIAIQGECIGPKIQGNKYSVRFPEFYAFNVTTPHGRMNSIHAAKLLGLHDISFVPILHTNYVLPDTVEEMVTYAHGTSVLADTLREGVVIRSTDGKKSFKVVDPEFLLKHNE